MRHRVRTVALVVVATMAILGTAFVWALPEIVRRVALDQIPKRTGRAASIDDVDLNLFTGRVALTNVRLAERDGRETFVTLEGVQARLSIAALLHSDIRLTEVTVVAPSVRVVRTGPGEFNFSDLMAPAAPTPPTSQPSRWTLTIDRLALSRGTIAVHDRAVSPPADWLVQHLGVEAAGLTTRARAAPGRLAVHADIDEAALDVKAEPLALEPAQLAATIALTGFETRRLNPYVFVPLGTRYVPLGGRLSVALQAKVDSDANELKKAALSGTVTLEGESLSATDRTDPFLRMSRLSVDVKEANAIDRTLTIARVAMDGLDVKARRDAKGVIDLLDMFTAKAPAVASAPASSAASAPAPAPVAAAAAPPVERKLVPVLSALARGFEQIRVERITLAPSTATIVDESVKPTTTLALTQLRASIDDVTWPVRGPAMLAMSTGLPGGGTLEVKGPVVAQPFDADLTFTLRDAPVAPYQAYVPVPARLSGRFSGDSRNRIAMKDGQMLLLSKGNSWAQDVEIRAPGVERPMIRVERMDLVGLDFDWPKRVAFAKASFRKLSAEMERAADGSINIRRLFEEPGAPPAKAQAKAPAPPRRAPAAHPPTAPEKPGLLQTLQLDFKEVRVEQGFIRFIDRSTTPAFSQDFSKLDLRVTDISNRAGKRAKLALKSVVGGDSALDVRGEIGPIGAPAFADVVGELRSFKLASVGPYAQSAIGWAITKGSLDYKVRFKLDGDQLNVGNDIVVGRLQVAPSSGGDEVKQRLGLPLGLIVSLVKDGNGEIRMNVPVTGSLNDPKFDLRETIWTAVKNVLVNIVKAPFRAISRLFSRGDDKLEEPTVDPVTFAAGSSVVAPDMEEHLLRVADFLRRSPFVNLSLAAAGSAADADALRAEAVRARLAEFQKAHGLKDMPATVAAYFKAQLPDVTMPATLDEQLALLRAREPVPDGPLADLGRRRVEATRERLVTVEGIPAKRLVSADAKGREPEAGGPGRVEFSVVAGAN